ncbi:MAG: MobH family relaxase [Burkholderiales bacterium]
MALFSFLVGDRSHAPSLGCRGDAATGGDVGAYPAVDPGIACVRVDEILYNHADLLSRIKLCYGSNREEFEAELLVSIRNYAAFVNMLPATPDNFFSEAGGLFRLGLEVAFYSLQGTDGHIVSGRATISTRRQLEPRWRHATFLAGLCSEIYRTLSNVVVINERGDEWPCYLGPLSDWLQQSRAKRFFVRWLANRHESRALGLFALPRIVPAATMQHLAQGNTFAVPQLMSCLSGVPMYREQNILVDLVKRAAALVIDRDLLASANRYGRPILGAHIERYLIDAMRRLVVSLAAWAPNQERSRVWYGSDGLFIVWPNAAAEIRKLLEEDELPGIPKSPETIVEILLSAGVFSARGPGQALWTIRPPPGKAVMEAVKLSSPEILLPTYSRFAVPLDAPLVVDANAQLEPSATPVQSATKAAAASANQQSLPGIEQITDASVAERQSPRAPSAAHSLRAAAPAELNDEPCIQFKLAAPMRLSPQVRDALASAVDTLNHSVGEGSALTIATGLFIPLEHFRRAKVDIAVVLRGLADAAMTVGAKGARATAVHHDIAGQAVAGVVLKPEFVSGLDPRDFTTSDPID